MAKVLTHLLTRNGDIPNNPTLPLLIYEDAFPVDISPSEIEAQLQENRWQNTWVNGVFSYHHYHSNAHEVLGCFAGSAEVQFGGPDGPVVSLSAGAAVIIPAGVGHCKLESTSDFGVVGGYPPGPANDLHSHGDSDPDAAMETIALVPLPPTDPVFGENGPLFDHWR